ncbi:biogenesis of lysosome-related organelles complex 1 subunit KXD1 [Aspergillus udagawae]|uniref:Biogenesis of lysosome-related organelles complex 1 subunit KXD1 n=1 Tax=Aspergillus udagawae TaxID=91492 RepID=A0A8H3RZP9_9EURO|nr:biogenesis of lysosome-related organelles complex 1 subunit KXD1 [Aspergillus udagawae]
MATRRYQPAALPINVPSKAPAPASLFPISRISGSPPDISDTSTTTGSRVSGFSYGSGALSGDYESSSASYSGIDVVEILSDRMQDVFDPTPLDRGLAKQAQTSGQLNAKQRELLELQALAQRRLKGVRANFSEGIKIARETKSDLEWTQKRVKNFVPSALKSKAEKAYPSEYRRAAKKYTFDDEN